MNGMSVSPAAFSTAVTAAAATVLTCLYSPACTAAVELRTSQVATCQSEGKAAKRSTCVTALNSVRTGRSA